MIYGISVKSYPGAEKAATSEFCGGSLYFQEQKMETERTASFLNLGSYDRINIILTVCHLDIDRYSVHHIWENMIFERQVENDLYLYIFITSGKYFTGCR